MSPGRIALLGFKEVPANMHPAPDVCRAGGVQRVVTRVTIGVDVALVTAEESLGELLLVAGAEIKHRVRIRRSRRRRPRHGPSVAD